MEHKRPLTVREYNELAHRLYNYVQKMFNSSGVAITVRGIEDYEVTSEPEREVFYINFEGAQRPVIVEKPIPGDETTWLALAFARTWEAYCTSKRGNFPHHN